MKTVLIQVPITFIESNPNIAIEFDNNIENYGKVVVITITENKSLRAIPKSWDYTHVLQETNLVEFTNVDCGNYFINVKSLDDSIENSFKVKTKNKVFNIGSIANTDNHKIMVSLNNSLGDVTARRGGFNGGGGGFNFAGGGGGGKG